MSDDKFEDLEAMRVSADKLIKRKANQTPASEPSHPCDYSYHSPPIVPEFAQVAKPDNYSFGNYPGEKSAEPRECEKCERFALWHAKQIAPLIDRIATLRDTAHANALIFDKCNAERKRYREAIESALAESSWPLVKQTLSEALLPKIGANQPTAAYEVQRDVSADDEFGIEWTKEKG